MKKKDKPNTLNSVIGTWTGAATFMVIMTAFGWWYAWWAYIALIGIISGAIQQTVTYVQKKNALAEQNNSEYNSKNSIQTDESNQIAYCPGCGKKIEPDTTQCSTCGYAI